MNLRQADFPVIITNEPTGFSPINFVDHDHASSLERALHLFLEHGHRRIAVMLPSTTMPASFQKLKSLFINTLFEHGIRDDVDPYWCYIEKDPSRNDSLYRAQNALEDLLDLPEPPTAIFFFSKFFLKYAQDVFKRRGLRIPDDISIINSPYNPYLYPDISGFDIQYEEMARLLLEGIHKTIENPYHHLQKLIPAKYIDKGTVAYCRAGRHM